MALSLNLIKENKNLLPDTLEIVRVPRDSMQVETKVFDYEKNWEIFRRLLEIYHLLKEVK